MDVRVCGFEPFEARCSDDACRRRMHATKGTIKYPGKGNKKVVVCGMGTRHSWRPIAACILRFYAYSIAFAGIRGAKASLKRYIRWSMEKGGAGDSTGYCCLRK